MEIIFFISDTTHNNNKKSKNLIRVITEHHAMNTYTLK